MFSKQGAFIVNEKGKVMDVSGGQDRENQNIIAWSKHGRVNQ
jgi:NADPH-dependent glutamate synthase beta subunit-like oxidoreductase